MNHKYKRIRTPSPSNSESEEQNPDPTAVVSQAAGKDGNEENLNIDGDNDDSESEVVLRTPKKKKMGISPKKKLRARVTHNSSYSESDNDDEIAREKRRNKTTSTPIAGNSKSNGNMSDSPKKTPHTPGRGQKTISIDSDGEERDVHDMTTLPLRAPADEDEMEIDSDDDLLPSNEYEGNENNNGIDDDGENGGDQGASSSGSDTEDEAQHPEFGPDNDTLTMDDLFARAIDPTEVPLLNLVLYLHHKLEHDFKVLSPTEFSVRTYVEHYQTQRPTEQYTDTAIRAFRNMDCYFDNRTRSFVFPIKLDMYLDILHELGLEQREIESLKNNGFFQVIKALSRYRPLNMSPIETIVPRQDLEHLHGFHQLRDYQQDGIQFIVSREGRAMIADEPGMGKTAEAIIASLYYEKEWPMLVLCERNLQEHWVKELRKWLPEVKTFLSIDDTSAYKNFNFTEIDPDFDPDVVIISYSLFAQLKKVGKDQGMKEKNFGVLILDSSNKIKYTSTRTSKAVKGLTKRAKRRILLSSNPASGVPIELFRQLITIDREAFRGEDPNQLAGRYCGSAQYGHDLSLVGEEPVRRRLTTSTNWRDAENLDELRHIIFSTVVIRHHRANHFTLPGKRREKILLQFNPDGRTASVLEEILQWGQEDRDFCCFRDLQSRESPDTGANKYIFKWYKLSAWAKLPLVWQYLDQFDWEFWEARKVIIYYRHKCMMEGIGKYLNKKRIRYVRIRNPRKAEERTKKERCEEFNADPNVRIALMNMQVSDADVDLHMADTVIFTELYWVPDAIYRNENRAVGPLFTTQPKPFIDIKYLVAHESSSADSLHIDGPLWAILTGKMEILCNLGLILDNDNFATGHVDTDFTPDPDWDFLTPPSPDSLLGPEADVEYEPDPGSENEDDDNDDLSEIPSDEFSDNDSSGDDDDNDDGHGHGAPINYTESTPSSSLEQNAGHKSHEASEESSTQGGPSTRTRRRSKHEDSPPGTDAETNPENEDELNAESQSQPSPEMVGSSPETRDRDIHRRSILIGESDSEDDDVIEDSPSSSLEEFVVQSTQDEDYDPDYVPSGEISTARQQRDEDSESEENDNSEAGSESEESQESETESSRRTRTRQDDDESSDESQ